GQHHGLDDAGVLVDLQPELGVVAGRHAQRPEVDPSEPVVGHLVGVPGTLGLLRGRLVLGLVELGVLERLLGLRTGLAAEHQCDSWLSGGRDWTPVEPYPPIPLTDSGRASTSVNTARSKRWKTSCATRSPRRSSTGSTGSWLTSSTLISPR